MRKTNRNLKRQKFIRRIVIFLIIQVFFIAFFVFSLKVNNRVDESECKNVTITVDDMTYEYKFLIGRTFSVFSDSQEYVFPKFAIWGTEEYSSSDLHSSINKGDKIVIEYVKDSTLYGNEYNLILSARTENEILRTKDTYISYLERQNIVGIIVFSVVELIFLAIFSLFFVVNAKDLKIFSSKRKRKKM